ncbi:DUF4298 domain-containing protein [Flavobacteriaceae bacterium Ap0902]|nr:DUF4298 domain-containing protein [Flavobacteriaceae bacterium Ap0902]
MSKDDIQSREEKVRELDESMHLLGQDTETLIGILSKLKEIQKRKSNLETYYYNGGYLADLEIENQFKDTYGILSEDGLHNLFYEINQAELEIIKYLVNKL